jgi:hypothetical protein
MEMASISRRRSASGEPELRIKALTFRSFCKAVDKVGRRQAVLTRVPPETRQLMESPPLPGSWIDLWCVWHIVLAIEDIGGPALVREVSRQATDDARGPYMRIVDSVLKMFGTSPATLLKRMNALVGSFIEGAEYRYVPHGERSCVMEVAYRCSVDIPDCVFLSLIPTFVTLVESCGQKGVVAAPQRVDGTTARYLIQW